MYQNRHDMKTIEDYVKEIKEASDADWQKRGFNMKNAPTFKVKSGSKFHKVIVIDGWHGGESVHCFVDMQGNIYKASTWKAPAKGIRGNINNDKKPLLGYQFYWRR